jgi:uncharacterized membrane protein
MWTESFFVRIGAAVLGAAALFVVEKIKLGGFATALVLVAVFAAVVGVNKLYDRKQIAKDTSERGWLNAKISSTWFIRGRLMNYSEWYAHSHYKVAYCDREHNRLRAHCRIDWKGNLEWLYVDE